jgi:mono/diheme cytochrome c family protein
MIKRAIILFISIAFFSCNNSDKSNSLNETKADAVSGEQLFKINCAQCHRPNEDFTGPALAGASKRWTDKNLLYDFVHNPQHVIQRDKYATELFTKWKNAYMQPFPNLSKEEIDAVLEYCDKYK